MLSHDWPHHAATDGKLSRVSQREVPVATISLITELLQDHLWSLWDCVLLGISLGNVHCSRNSERIIGDDR
jgi:hypothetical protein